MSGLDDTLPEVDPHATERASVPSYELGAVLGTGGMGEVLLAHDVEMGRDVALKRMRGAAPTRDMTARFLREARIQARLDHPAIVPVHALGRDANDRPYFTMKRLAGITLQQSLETRAHRPQKLLRAFVEVCHAIEVGTSEARSTATSSPRTSCWRTRRGLRARLGRRARGRRVRSDDRCVADGPSRR